MIQLMAQNDASSVTTIAISEGASSDAMASAISVSTRSVPLWRTGFHPPEADLLWLSCHSQKALMSCGQQDQRQHQQQAAARADHDEGVQAIADAAHGADAIIAQFAAQVVDVHFQRVGTQVVLPGVEDPARSSRIGHLPAP